MTDDSRRSLPLQLSSTVSVAVCTRDRPRELAVCLESLRAQTLKPERVLVINAGLELGDLGDDVDAIAAKPGLPRQRNVALPMVSSDLVAFLDDDVELEPMYLATIAAWFDEQPACIGAGGHIVNDKALSNVSKLFRRTFDLGIGDGRLRPSGDALYLYHPSTSTRVDFLSGSNMVWRREAIVGLRFDEHLEGYGYMEDVDFSLRAGKRGELWIVPAARLTHAKTATARVPPRSYVSQVIGNGAYLFAKHRQSSGLRWPAYARRLVGRTVGYVGVAVRARSRDPFLGLLDGLSLVRRMQRAGREHTRE